jgi:hypothetical protein
MPIPLLAMALGGAALGALSNKKDRKKGALMGLGAGLLGPAIGAMGAAGTGTAVAAAPLSAGAAGAAGTAAAGAAIPAAAGAAVPAAGGGMAGFAKTMAPMLIQGAMPEEGPPPPQAGPSMAMQNQGNQPQANLYNQAMVNQQERMKRRNHTRGMR